MRSPLADLAPWPTIAVALALAAVAPGQGAPGARPAEAARAAATPIADDSVLIELDGGLRITEGEYRAFLRDAVGSARLDELVWDRLLEREFASFDPTRLAERAPGLAAALADPDAAAERRLAARIAADHGGDPERWIAHVHTLGRRPAEERAIQRTDLLRELRSTALIVVARVPDEQALRRVFEQRHGREGLAVEGEQLFVPFPTPAEAQGHDHGHDHDHDHGAKPPVDEATREATRVAALALLDRARNAPSLEAIGGEALRPGWDQLYGIEFEDRVRALAAGRVEGPLESRRGWHLVRVTKRTLTREADVRDAVLRAFFEAPPTLGELRRLRERLFAASGASRALAARLTR